MTIWLPQLRRQRPLYLEIADAIRQDLSVGTLKPGDRLPPQRDLAFRLGVTTGTVTRAYAEAEKMGLLVGEVGRGSFLKAPGPQAQPFVPVARGTAGILDLSLASPPAVQETGDLDSALAQIMTSPGRLDLLGYPPPESFPLHRAMGAQWLSRSGIVVDEQQVVVTAGAQAAIIATLSFVSQPGDRLFVEGLNYPTIKPIARQFGIELVPLEVDAGGLVPQALERAARAGEARTLYVVPTLQSPTTATLNLERRLAIADIARRYGLTLIEDDIFRLLDPRLQPPTFYSLAPERTYHITSVSKTLAPGLRVGFLVGPAGKTDGLIRHQTITNGRSVGLAAEVARHWIEGGTADRILAAIIAENAARRDIARDVLRGRDFLCNPGAPFLWLRLPDHWQPGDFVRAALDCGIKISSGTAFAIDRRADDRAIRICFGGTSSRDDLRKAFHAIGALLDEDPAERFTQVA
ncbi:PLP-dependent aminotransferase family protein [Aestuariivirga sp.]|uniref:aminotransferase-like domain-containing protein n=1 Tax=Aestuariivirga sp. TaxID=2650926 RepID=UPI0035947FCB